MLYATTPSGRREHWLADTAEFPDEPGRILLVLHSHHWHEVLNLRCEVEDPTAAVWLSPVLPMGVVPAGESLTALCAPDHTVATVEFPEDFAAPKVAGGDYKVRWVAETEGRSKPITLIRDAWTTVG